MSKYKFLVYLDGQRLGECSATKQAAKAWIRDHITSTHMGEWRKVNGIDYHYHTTIGRTYTFMKVPVGEGVAQVQGI